MIWMNITTEIIIYLIIYSAVLLDHELLKGHGHICMFLMLDVNAFGNIYCRMESSNLLEK